MKTAGRVILSHSNIQVLAVVLAFLVAGPCAATADDSKSNVGNQTGATRSGEQQFPEKSLVPVNPSVAVQMLVPGFTARELPVELTNVNNVRYRHDGKLVALAYDGNVYLLSDTDGDGLEDVAELFWDNQGRLRGTIGMALTPPDYPHGNGLFVPSYGKCSLIVDTDGDDRADKEIVIAEGWEPIQHSLDAVGVAVGKDGSIFFGLGTMDYSNPYLLDKETGQARYDHKSERGTILRVSPDFASREIVCTGIRWPVSLAVNRQGDLFCTDQEGATWLANGNPFDELLHIQKGRHYGFPPRHPKHLPDVIDEPSVFDYGPQHQSTCGLFFNRGVNGGPVFGPQWWADDALVCGYSRGKLYRTKLVKTAAGYMGKNQIIACLNMLTADACVAPDGGLVIAVHSGGPDWGTGPNGKGKLYKVTYSSPSEPQPVSVWAAGPQEVRIAFDRPLDPERLKQLSQQTSITYGAYVRAGDRFESLRPGYAAVELQMATPRYELPVHGVQVTSDRRTLILATPPHPEASHYAVTMPGPRSEHDDTSAAVGLPQHNQIELDYDLTGVAVDWKSDSGESAHGGWLPHLDLTTARAFTGNSAEHDRFWAQLGQPGKLSLRTKLNLTDMLRPAIQPASIISYEWPQETVTLVFRARSQIDVRVSGAQIEQTTDASGHHIVTATFNPRRDEMVPVEIVLTTDRGQPSLEVAYHTAEDARPRTLALRRLLVPWAPQGSQETESLAQREIPQLRGGNWTHGRELFFSEKAQCAKCHTIRGQGEEIGPDLSNLVHRDYESVLRDITQPNFAINPEYITFTVVLDDGRVLKGPIRTVDGNASISDEKGNVTVFSPNAVEQLEAARESTMSEDLAKGLSSQETKDLLTYLLVRPPSMPNYGSGTPPPPRRRAEVQAVLQGAPTPSPETRPINVVLVAGKKDHGPGEHDYPAWQQAWAKLLSMNDQTTITTASDWPSGDDFKTADVIVFYQRGAWTAERAGDIDAFLARGGGLVYIHWAVDGNSDAPGLAQRIGLAWQGDRSKYRHGPLELKFGSSDHPIVRNFDRLQLYDESYWRLTGDAQRIDLLATGAEEGQPQPLIWTRESGGGRVFVSIPGHFSWTFDDPLFRVLLLRGIAWAAREPVDRFNDLVTIGARIVD